MKHPIPSIPRRKDGRHLIGTAGSCPLERFTGKEMVMRKLKTPLVYILAALTLPLLGTVAPAATVTVVQTFDFPDLPVETSATLPQKISDQGDLVGTVIDVNGASQGFIYRYRAGIFSAGIPRAKRHRALYSRPWH